MSSTLTITIDIGTGYTSGDRKFFGDYSVFIVGEINGFWRIMHGGSWKQTNISVAEHNRVKFVSTATAVKMYEGDSLLETWTRNRPNTGTFVATIGGAFYTSSYQLNSARYYSLRITNGEDVLSDFQPVRVGSGSSAVGYIYDKANPTGGPLGNGLYGNSGTGAFTIGPDKNA
jgi:hypothetical protein